MAAPAPAQPLPRRRRALAGLALGVAALHLALLDPRPSPPATGPVQRALVVRRIVVEAPGNAPAAAGPTAAPPAPARAAPPPPAPPAPRAPAAAPAPPPAAAPVPAAAEAAAAEQAPVVAATPPPLYPVRLPGSRTQGWERRRGAAVDTLVLDWQLDGDGYRIALRDAAGDGWASRGAVGAHGIEPERLVERRRGRDVRATNFRRDAGRISFSGAAAEHPLLPGAQDRAGWLLQLAGVVAAAPQRLGVPGAVVELFVAGSRGEAGVWRFAVEAVEPLELPAGPVPAALRLAREPGQRWEPRIEVWLDPARGHLPVRWRTRVADSGQTVDHRLAADEATGP